MFLRPALIASLTVLLYSSTSPAQRIPPLPLTVGNQGLDGPATPAAPLIASNRSFIETTWCRQQGCTLVSKTLSDDGYRLPPGLHLVAYTYATRVGTAKVWRLDTTGQALKVLFRPQSHIWSTQTVQSLFSLVTGQAIHTSVLEQCAAQTASWRALTKGSFSNSAVAGKGITYSLNCEVDRTARPALTAVTSVPSASGVATAVKGTAASKPAPPPAARDNQEPFRQSTVGCIDRDTLTQILQFRFSGR